MKIGVPDLVTNSYFNALAAEELGFYRAEGIDAHVDLLTPVPLMLSSLRDGSVDMLATSAHLPLMGFPKWKGTKLVVTLARGTPWLLVMRSDLGIKRGDVTCVKGRRIGAAGGPDAALKKMLADSGIDLARDQVRIEPVPGYDVPGTSFGVLCAKALEAKEFDGFWANAMGAETSVRRGVGQIIIDVRRGDGPAAAKGYTFACLVARQEIVDREPDAVAAAVRAIVKVQRVLRAEPARATEVGRKRFPPAAAEIIADLIERDRGFYDPVITEEDIKATSDFSRSLGLLSEPVPYDQVVATRFRPLWTAP
jgi:ABC-type nitrate/sulfonate/bicarbonate transport system substrate-binding protein